MLIQHQLLPKWIRKDEYKYETIKWNTLHDRDDSDFESLVNEISDSKQSYHIRGRAGTGKSTLIKQIMKTMKERKLHCEATAPTNKACRVINGKTIHKFIYEFNLERFKEKKFKNINSSMKFQWYMKYFISSSSA